METPSNEHGSPPFHRGNYKITYTQEESQYLRQFASNWFKSKGLISAIVGAGIPFALIKAGKLTPNYQGVKIAAGAFAGFAFMRNAAMIKVHGEIKEKFPNGYVAQMNYLRKDEKAFNDYIDFARHQKSAPSQQMYRPQNNQYPTAPYTPPPSPQAPYTYSPPPQAPYKQSPPPQAPIDSSPASSGVTNAQQTPKGLDDRFRPQVDGLNQGKTPFEEEEKMGKPVGSYAMWRQQSGPPKPGLGADPPRYSPPPDTYTPPPPPSQYDRLPPPPGSYEAPPRRPASSNTQGPRKPVRRNEYGDIIED